MFDENKTEGDFAISLTRMESDYPLNVMVAPIGTGAAGKGAVLFVYDPAEPVELSIESICRLYGLTPAEGRLALGLTNGHKLDDLAEEWGVSMHTVRSQLRQIWGGKSYVASSVRMVDDQLAGGNFIQENAKLSRALPICCCGNCSDGIPFRLTSQLAQPS